MSRTLTGPRIYDQIITFNYDLVVEKLAALSSSSALRAESIVLPGAAIFDGLHVLHLHGCVSWRDGETVTTENPEKLLRGGQCPLLGTPGPTKKRYATDRFAPLWEAARAGLKTADRIVFLGYRFPPSDAQARRTILGAISDNVTKFLDIYTVVRGNAEDSARLGELLRVAAHGNHRRDAEVIVEGPKLFRLKQHALFVEDFLSLYPQVIGL